MLENLKLGDRYDGFLFLAEAARNPPSLKSHHHIELELNLVVRGSITYIVEGRRFTFGRRSLLWLFPSQEHQLVNRTLDAENYVAVFKPGMIASACRGEVYKELKRHHKGRAGVLHTELDAATFDVVSKTMASVMDGSLDPDLLNREAGFVVGSNFRFEHGDPDGLNAGLRHLLLLCWRCQCRGGTPGLAPSLHPAIRKAIALLSDEDSDLNTLARRCGISAAYLSRTFRAQIGVPISRYRNSVRLGRFWESRNNPRIHTITEAVYAAGFGSYAQFFKIFKEAYGRGPRKSLAQSPPPRARKPSR